MTDAILFPADDAGSRSVPSKLSLGKMRPSLRTWVTHTRKALD